MEIDRSIIAGSQQLVIDVFRGFRAELMKAYGAIEFSRKADSSQVTRLDITVEQTLKDRLAVAYPEFGFQGEETGKSGNERQYWLVDPIDSTSSFIRGMPFCTNMAALIKDNQSVAAVIYDFVADELYTAVRGEGAYQNEHPLHVNTDRLSGNLFVYSLSGRRFDDLHKTMFKAGMKCYYPVGAAGHMYVMLAKGEIDGVVVLNTRTSVHDNAPGLLIVSEAGGDIVSFDGQNDISIHEFVAGTPVVAEQVRQHQADFLTLIGH
ncbi:MAG: inositol monophosphatase [Candidatus Saccharibacteria bacterium]